MKVGTKGFTMLEMAMVLIIMGILAGLLIPAMITPAKRDKISAARENLDALRQKVIGYAIASKRLPLAADAMFQARDPWGQAYGYAPNAALTSPTVNFCGLKPPLSSPPVVLTSSGSVSDVAFILRSNGPNAKADVNLSASPVDLRAPDDDLVEFVTFYQLFRLACH